MVRGGGGWGGVGVVSSRMEEETACLQKEQS